MTQYTSNFLPWSSISISSEDLYYQQQQEHINSSNNNNNNNNNDKALTPPMTPLSYKGISTTTTTTTSSNTYFNPTPSPILSEQQQLQIQQQYYNYHIQNIPPKISIKLNDFGGLSLETNMTDIARLRNYLLSFALQSTQSNNNSNDNNIHLPTSPSPSSSSSGQLILRNKKIRNKPVNLFKRIYELGQQNSNNPFFNNTNSILFFQQLILRQHTVIACIHTYFDCWVRYFPVFSRQHVLAVLDEPRGLDSIIVNAISCFVLKHMFAHHHYPPALAAIRRDPTKIRDMEEFFFNTAKNTLENKLFDNDGDQIMTSRFDIFGMLLMSYKVDMKKKAIYMAMAVQSLQALQIQPEEKRNHQQQEQQKDSTYEEELDIRLWWMTWMNDFAVYTSGCSTNMPFSCCDDDGFMVDPILKSNHDHDHSTTKKKRVPKLWSFDCDGASEYGIMVNEHCLSIWRIQAEIVRHQYQHQLSDQHQHSQGGVVDSTLLEGFDSQIQQFLNHLPTNLKPHMPYDPSPISLVRARVHTELNATKIILHKLYIPDDGDDNDKDQSVHMDLLDNSILYQWKSLNICLKAAMDQIHLFYYCVMVYPNELRCGFDRDELWRSTEIISIALDFLNKLSIITNHHHHHHNENPIHIVENTILNNIGTVQTLNNALSQSLKILQHTYELQCNNSNFRQLEDWLKERIHHHSLQHHHHKQQSFHHLQHPQINIPASSQQQHPVQSPTSPVPILSPSLSTASSSSSSKNSQIHSSFSSITNNITNTSTSSSPSTTTQHQRRKSSTTVKKRKTSTGIHFVPQQMSFSTKTISTPSPPPTTTPTPSLSSSSTSSTSSTSVSSPQFNSFSTNTFSSTSSPSSSSSKTRFRYFSPKENRGLLFIDENPDNQ